MTRTSVVISVLLVLQGVSGALAFNEPKDFRGMPWGASEAQLRTTLGGPESAGRDIDLCLAIPSEHRQLGDRLCWGRFILGDTAVQAIYYFRSDHFVTVALNYAPQDFDRIAAVFIERYGAPTSEERPRFKSLDGITATNQILRWDGPRIAIVLRRYAGMITEGLGSITTQDEVRESRRIFREETERAIKDR
jgi:hypothetical protein